MEIWAPEQNKNDFERKTLTYKLKFRSHDKEEHAPNSMDTGIFFIYSRFMLNTPTSANKAMVLRRPCWIPVSIQKKTVFSIILADEMGTHASVPRLVGADDIWLTAAMFTGASQLWACEGPAGEKRLSRPSTGLPHAVGGALQSQAEDGGDQGQP